MREVMITVYDYNELDSRAKCNAHATISQILYDFEFEDWDWTRNKFNELLFPHCFINHEDLRFLLNKHIGDWRCDKFLNEYQYHGLRDTHYVKKAFQKFMEHEWENFLLEEYDIVEYCDCNEIVFFENGTIYRE